LSKIAIFDWLAIFMLSTDIFVVDLKWLPIPCYLFLSNFVKKI